MPKRLLLSILLAVAACGCRGSSILDQCLEGSPLFVLDTWPGCSHMCPFDSCLGGFGTAPPIRTNAIIEVETGSADPLALEPDDGLGEVTIRNVGDDTLQLQFVEIERTTAWTVDTTDLTRLLGPDDSTVLVLHYEPLAELPAEGVLRIGSNDREHPEVGVRLLTD